MARRKEQMRETQDDLVRDVTNDAFSHKDDTSARRYEYVTVEQTAAAGGDEKFARRVKIRAIYKDTVDRCKFLSELLCKRPLKPSEQARLTELKQLKQLAEQSDSAKWGYKEENEYDELRSIELTKKEADFLPIISGTHRCYHYKNAHKVLLPGTSFDEWNGDTSTSKETKIDEANARQASIAVFEFDYIEYAKQLKERGLNPLIMLSGSKLQPGGDWEKGTEGLEESLWYRSSISVAIDREINDGFYPLRNESIIYVPKSMIFRHPKERDYLPYDRAMAPSYVATATVSGAISGQQDDPRSGSPDYKSLVYMEKLKNVFQLALFHGHDSLVLTALGCYHDGVDPEKAVQLLLNVIFDQTTKFYLKFQNIVVCVPPNILPSTTEKISPYPGKTVERTTDPNKVIFNAFRKLHMITYIDATLEQVRLT